jgi:predicted DNA-binding protein YlxM (UPF0122 family)
MEKKGNTAGKRGHWTEAQIKATIDNVLSNKMSVRQASEAYSVPESSLYDRLIRRSEILTSNPLKIKLEEKRQAKVNKADQQRKRKETRGKICLNKSHQTKSRTASERRLQSCAQVDLKVDRPKET